MNKNGILHGAINEEHVILREGSFFLKDFLIEEKLEEFHTAQILAGKVTFISPGNFQSILRD